MRQPNHSRGDRQAETELGTETRLAIYTCGFSYQRKKESNKQTNKQKTLNNIKKTQTTYRWLSLSTSRIVN